MLVLISAVSVKSQNTDEQALLDALEADAHRHRALRMHDREARRAYRVKGPEHVQLALRIGGRIAHAEDFDVHDRPPAQSAEPHHGPLRGDDD